MTIDIIRLKALATAAAANQYDSAALNDYGTALPPATVLGLIAEIERHRHINAEGCKPDSNIQLSGLPCAGAASCHSLDKAEGEQPDLNFQLLLLAERSCSLLEDWVQHTSVSDQGLNDQIKETRELLEEQSPTWSTAIRDLLAERRRQVREEGHTLERDDQYTMGNSPRLQAPTHSGQILGALAKTITSTTSIQDQQDSGLGRKSTGSQPARD